MAALIGIAPNLRTILAAHVALQIVDGGSLRSTDNIQHYRLVRVAAEATDLQVEIPRVQGVAQSGRWLGRTFETQHALVPGNACETVSFLTSFGGTLRRMPD
jgi:hypothetical protein